MEGDTGAADGRKELRGSGPLWGFSGKTPTDGNRHRTQPSAEYK